MRSAAPSDRSVVIGVDAGGSHTRAICVDFDGAVLGRGFRRGGSPTHNHDACAQVQGAIRDALTASGRDASDVRALTAGLAGYGGDSDESWATEFTAVEGLDCPRIHVNDAEVAHAGAFAGQPGIIVIAGTGSMIMGRTETGRHLNNIEFRHYAGGARHLSIDAMHHILIKDVDLEDIPLINDILKQWDLPQAWSVDTRRSLHEAVTKLATADDNDVKRHYGKIAPLVTEHADTSPLARAAVDRMADKTRVGIELIAGAFSTEAVQVCLVGGLATAPTFITALGESFRETQSRCTLMPPQLGPVEGAALLALQSLGIDDRVIISPMQEDGREPG